ncbi:MAG: exosortase/archaeosortase family protein [Acidobacteriaceae bacterium]|jgi:exosortase
MQDNTVVAVTSSDPSSANDPQGPASVGAGQGPAAPSRGNNGGWESTAWRIPWGQLAILGALLVLLYYHIAVKLVTDWYNLPDFSHGFLIPFFAAFLLWDQRNELRRIPIVPSWMGTTLVVLGTFELVVGVFGADLFLQRTSFVLLLAGLIWTLLGKRMLVQLKFLLFVLLLAIPLPAVLYNQITFPLQLQASQFASDILPLFRVPVLQEGNIIQLPAMPLEVAEACSGIRSLMSLFTVAVIYGYFLEKKTWRKWVLALSALPIAVTANVVRIVGTGLCVQYWDPEKAMGFFHDFQGWLMFLVSLGCLYLVHVAMRLMAREGRRPA